MLHSIDSYQLVRIPCCFCYLLIYCELSGNLNNNEASEVANVHFARLISFMRVMTKKSVVGLMVYDSECSDTVSFFICSVGAAVPCVLWRTRGGVSLFGFSNVFGTKN